MKLLSLLMILTACASAPTSDGPVAFHVLRSGSNAQDTSDPAPRVFLAVDQESYLRIWQRVDGSAQAPSVDFSRESVAFLLLGNRNTGGYEIDVKTASASGNLITIEAPVTSPGRRAIVTQVLTAPYTIVSLAKKNAGPVRWMSAGRELAASSR
jgi:hypothetical protein